MGHSQRLRVGDVRVLMRLLREVCELGNDARGWRIHMLRQLRGLIGAGLCVHYVHGLPANPGQLQFQSYFDIDADPLWHQYLARRDVSPDPMTPGMTRLLGRTVVRSEDQLCSIEQWQSSQFFNEVLRPLRADHELASLAVLPDRKRFSCIGFGRQMGDPPFGRRERQAIHLFHTELVELWRVPTAVNGSEPKLSPRMQDTLSLIRKGMSEKEIAADLGLSPHTVHDYVKALYRQFGAHSATELLARANHAPRFRPKMELT